MKPRIGSGDAGVTGMPGGRRVLKTSAAVEALGAIDEAAAAVGLARALVANEAHRALLSACQEALGDCAAEVAAAGRARATAFDFPAATSALEDTLREISRTAGEPAGFVMAGENPAQAALHLARTVVRRAERRVFALDMEGRPVLALAAVYLNRLSDLLFDLARTQEDPRKP